MRTVYVFLLAALFCSSGYSQTYTNTDRLQQLEELFRQRYEQQKEKAIQWAIDNNFPIRRVYDDGTIIEIQRITPNGKPIYYSTENVDAAGTISSDDVWSGGSAGLNLTGSGQTLGEWDGGQIRYTHQDLTGRVTWEDSASPSSSQHSTHVAGTMIGSGVNSNAQGMAEGANLRAWDYNNDTAEMSGAAASLYVSNHSYGIICGWDSFGINWYGDDSIDPNEDWKFGYYTSSESQAYDDIAYNAPYYLICASAGNDRGNSPLFGGPPPADAANDGGYDTVGPAKCAKNILTVGAVEDIPAGWTQASDVVMSSFSSWGPTDDGRIKPDVVGNGVSLFSCDDDSDADYATLSGTSMATPSISGSIALLHQHYNTLSSGSMMRAATVKALLIHTADEAGSNPGPDYRFGWGLVNIRKAAELLSDVFVSQDEHTLQERTLTNGGSYSFQVTSDGTQPLRVTIVWTDVPGTPVEPVTQIDPPDLMLVNDLDLRVTGNSTTYYPWTLDPANVANAALRSTDNFRDNVEQVLIDNPGSGTYTITVNHKGTLTNGPQAFSLLMSGAYYSDNSLPVQLSSFSALQQADRVKLYWVSESEENNLGYEIYKAASEGPWQLLADYRTHDQLEGAGNTSAKSEYSFEDTDVLPGESYRYRLADVDYSGTRTFHPAVSVFIDPAKYEGQKATGIAEGFMLYPNYPNPFNPQTKIAFQLPQATQVSLSIYDEAGRLVANLIDEEMAEGSYSVSWNAANMPSGIYFYRLSTPAWTQSRKMLLIK